MKSGHAYYGISTGRITGTNYRACTIATDRSTFRGIGFLPDVAVGPQAADFPATFDRELNQAVATLKQQIASPKK